MRQTEKEKEKLCLVSVYELQRTWDLFLLHKGFPLPTIEVMLSFSNDNKSANSPSSTLSSYLN